MHFQEMIEELAMRSIEITIMKVNEYIWYNLNTGMKSHLWIRSDNSGSKYYEARYNKSGCFNDLDELYQIAKECLCGRDYLHHAWQKILVEEGLISVQYNTTRSVSFN